MFGILLLLMCLISKSWSCDFYDNEMVEWSKERLAFLGKKYNNDNPCSELSFGFQKSLYHDGHSPRIYTIQNDEEELISDWLQYYSFKFGFNNINVFDHMSQKPEICRLLSMYLHCGVNVTTFSGYFNNGKAKLLSDEMTRATNEDRFLIPVDLDEFVTLSEVHENKYAPLNIQQLRLNLMRTFLELPVDGRKYKFIINNVFMSKEQCHDFPIDPTEATRRVLVDGNLHREPDNLNMDAKTFYFSRGFQSTDQENHRGCVDNDKPFGCKVEKIEELHQRYILSNISLYHYHAPSYSGYIHKVMRAVKAYGFDSLKNCTGVQNGYHYCDAFINHFDREKQICSRAAYIRMAGCGLKMDRPHRNDRFKSIFAIHAKSLQQLVGAWL